MNEHLNTLSQMTADDVKYILDQIGQPDLSTLTATVFVEPEAGTEQAEDEANGSKRRHIEREWPDVGTELYAEYYGQRYTAQIVPAVKKLKSGKQITLTSGPAIKTLCDSFSEAMLAATEQQRNQQGLGRKGVSNGWVFWQWNGKPESYNATGADDDA